MAKGTETAKEKKPRSEAQILAFARAREARELKRRQETGNLGGASGTNVHGGGTTTPQNMAGNERTRSKGGAAGSSPTSAGTMGQTGQSPVRGISDRIFDENWMNETIYLQSCLNQAQVLLNQAVIASTQGNYTLAHTYEIQGLNFLNQARGFTDNRKGR